ncbi:MAG: D-alanine--D-alanine ligase [Proteobacteria bacterium]|nr:D-alanine--D-alanine ligase [Pseudomonadota bacterium]
MTKKTLALISGGFSSEREVSISGGNQVFDALDKDKYLIQRYDPKFDLIRLVTDAPDIDVALIILHGPYGEDGTIQGMLELLDIPYQGSGVLGSALAIDKVASKKIFEQNNLPVPPYRIARKGMAFDENECLHELGLPLFVKPATGGSSIGMSRVASGNDLGTALEKAFEYDDVILIERFIKGTELTCSVIGNEDLTALPLIEIIPANPSSTFFDYEAKYSPGGATEICPARISDDLTQTMQALSIKAHKALGLRGYSRTDMILSDGSFYILETNTIPGMTRTSLLPLSAKTAGISFSQLLDRLIELALE